MPRWSSIVFVAACLLFPAIGLAEPVVVQAVVIEGLQSTRRQVVTRKLDFDVGDTVTDAELQAATQRLLDSGLFSRAEIDRDGDRIHILLEEKWSLLPIVELVRAGGLSRARLGVVEHNLLGYGWTAGAYYQRFGAQNGGEAWLELDELGGGSSCGLRTDLRGGWVYRPRPTFVHQRAGGRLSVGYAVGPVQADGGVFGRRDTLSDGLGGNTDVGLQGALRLGEVELRDGLPVGLSVGVSLERAFAMFGSDTSWNRIEIVARAAARGPFALNVSSTVRVGHTNAPHPEEAYFVGGRQVRGFADSEFVGRRAAIARFELRRTLFELPIFALQGSTFVDTASVGNFATLSAASTGAGLRIVFPWFAHSALFVEGVVPLVGDATSPILGGFEQSWDTGSFGLD